MRISDWSSDVCSSDLAVGQVGEKLLALVHGLDDAQFGAAAMGDFGADQRFGDDPDHFAARLQRRDIAIRRFVGTRSRTDIQRSAARRVGKGCVSTCRSRWSTYQ